MAEATIPDTNEREVLGVFVTHKTIRTNLLGKRQVVPGTAYRGEKVKLFADDEKRLDALGLLVPEGEGRPAQQIVDDAVRRALSPLDRGGVNTPVVPPAVSPPSMGAAPRGAVVPVTEPSAFDAAAFVAENKADAVVDRAGNDVAEAQALLDAEQARGDDARKTVVERLQKIIDGA